MAGFWPRKRPVLLAARWDGVIPLKLPVRPLEPRDVREIMSFIRKHGTVRSPFDLVNIGWTTEEIRTRFRSIRIQGDLVAREFVH